MQKPESQRLVRSYLAGAAWVLNETQTMYTERDLLDGITSTEALLQSARSALLATDEKREAKAKADRDRRAEAKRKPKARPTKARSFPSAGASGAGTLG